LGMSNPDNCYPRYQCGKNNSHLSTLCSKNLS
jgi:hypothetical protein